MNDISNVKVVLKDGVVVDPGTPVFDQFGFPDVAKIVVSNRFSTRRAAISYQINAIDKVIARYKSDVEDAQNHIQQAEKERERLVVELVKES